jgi:hypothetical protein
MPNYLRPSSKSGSDEKLASYTNLNPESNRRR